MEQTTAIWLIIGLALITANLPFIVKRPLLVLPWALKGEPRRPALLRWLESTVYAALMVGVCWLAYDIISSTLVIYTNAASIAAFYGKVIAYIAVFALLLAYPGWRARNHDIKKSFFVQLIEMFVLYLGVGVLAFALELNLGNRFPQTWEFYAITGSLFMVLGYPGFVFRYLMKRTRRPARPARRQSAGGSRHKADSRNDKAGVGSISKSAAV